MLIKIYLIWLGAVSLIALLAFAIDKRAAKRERRRIPETVLLWLAAFGGSVGACIGIWGIGHKRNAATKFHFRTVAVLALLVEFAILVLLLVREGGLLSI